MLTLSSGFCESQIGIKSTQYIIETPQDIQEALANFTEKVHSKGPEVKTIPGRQISPGAVPNDFAVNQEIFNDINKVQSLMIHLMQSILNLEVGKSKMNQVLLEINTLIDLIKDLGIRYNIASDFSLIIQQMQEIKIDLQNPPESPLSSPSTYYMLFKARLETLLAEIENKLQTKLAR